MNLDRRRKKMGGKTELGALLVVRPLSVLQWCTLAFFLLFEVEKETGINTLLPSFPPSFFLVPPALWSLAPSIFLFLFYSPSATKSRPLFLRSLCHPLLSLPPPADFFPATCVFRALLFTLPPHPDGLQQDSACVKFTWIASKSLWPTLSPNPLTLLPPFLLRL